MPALQMERWHFFKPDLPNGLAACYFINLRNWQGSFMALSRYEGTTLYTLSPLIRGFNVENISITANEGEGPLPVINGEGKKWREWEAKGNRSRVGQNDSSASYIRAKEINYAGIPIPRRRFDTEYLRQSIMQFFLYPISILIPGHN